MPDICHSTNPKFDANYIKSPYCEELPLSQKYGLMIASHGPTEKTQNDFWKMVISENVTKIVSLCEKMGDDYISYDKDDWKLKFLGNYCSDTK